MARVGRGPTLGHALIDAFRVLRRPPAISVHAQLAQLTATGRGQAILDRHAPAGPGHRNWLAWLSRDRTPNATSEKGIKAAYYEYLGRSPVGRLDHGTEGQIIGEVAIGNDLRDRGRDGNSPLRIDHREPPVYRWDRFDAAVRLPAPDANRVLDLYITDVLAGSIDFSDLPWFPGTSYEFTVT